MTDLLFDTPWWLPTAIVAVGVALFLSGNKRLIDRLRNAGLAVIGFGLLWAGVSYLVDTDKEKVIDRSHRLVRSVEEREWPVLESLLAPDVHFSGALREYGDRAQLVAATRTVSETVGLNNAHVTGLDLRVLGKTISTQIRVFSDTNKLAGQLIPSDWQLEWQDRPGQGWVVADIRLLQVGNVSAEAVRSQLPP